MKHLGWSLALVGSIAGVALALLAGVMDYPMELVPYMWVAWGTGVAGLLFMACQGIRALSKRRPTP